MASRAFLAGLTGAAAIGVISALARQLGMPYDVERLFGAFLTGPASARGDLAYVLGLLGHLAAGGVLGVLYVRLLARAEQPGLLAGAYIGLLHAVIMGVLLAALPLVHPAVPDVIAAPGLLLLEWGTAASLLHVVVHVGFGMWMSQVVMTPHPFFAEDMGAAPA